MSYGNGVFMSRMGGGATPWAETLVTPGESRTPGYSSRLNIAEVWVLAAAGFIYFFMLAHLSTLWASYGIYDQYNVIFDTDPNHWLSSISHGWALANFNHPLGPYIFSVPIRMFETGAALTGWPASIAFRESIGLLVAPLISSLKIPAFYIAFRTLGLKWPEALVVTALGTLAFSSVVFGPVPSGYPITGGLYAVAFFAAALSVTVFRHSSLAGLITVGVALIGITITNVISVGWFLWARFSILGSGSVRALVNAIVVAGFLLVCVLAVSHGANTMRTNEAELLTLSSGGRGYLLN